MLHGRLLQRVVADELDVGAVESVEDGVAHDAGAGPLRVVGGLWPETVVSRRGEALLNQLRRVRRRAIGAVSGLPGRAGAKRLVDDVNLVAILDKVRGPAASTIRFVEKILFFKGHNSILAKNSSSRKQASKIIQ